MPNRRPFLRPGERCSLELTPEGGMFRTVAVDIPRGTDSFRIDVYNTNADIDMFVSMKSPAKSRDEAMYIAESMLGSESLVIGGYSGEKTLTGRYYISLIDQLAAELPQKLSVVGDPKAARPPISSVIFPPFPVPRTDLRRRSSLPWR